MKDGRYESSSLAVNFLCETEDKRKKKKTWGNQLVIPRALVVCISILFSQTGNKTLW